MSKIYFATKEELAKFAVKYFFSKGKVPVVKSHQVVANLQPDACCFVSVYIGKTLRGCIGDYTVREPLYLNIIKNAINAAFSDFRFPPIQKKELKNLKVEVSVLSPLSELELETTETLLEILQEKKPGLLLQQKNQRALFLPQVWEKLPVPDLFLNSLCLKAGLSHFCWREKTTQFWIFSVK